MCAGSLALARCRLPGRDTLRVPWMPQLRCATPRGGKGGGSTPGHASRAGAHGACAGDSVRAVTRQAPGRSPGWRTTPEQFGRTLMCAPVSPRAPPALSSQVRPMGSSLRYSVPRRAGLTRVRMVRDGVRASVTCPKCGHSPGHRFPPANTATGHIIPLYEVVSCMK